jgi:beta-xylosidase
LQWQWHANYNDGWYSLTARSGWLRMYPQLAVNPINRQQNMLLQKFPARIFSIETLLDFSPKQDDEEAGLVVAGDEQTMLGIRHIGTKNQVVLRTIEKETLLLEFNENVIRLRVRVQDAGLCSFSYAIGDHEFKLIPQLYQAQKAMWIGAKVGLYSVAHSFVQHSGYVDVDYFRFSS